MIFFSGGLGCILALLVSLIFLETEYLFVFSNLFLQKEHGIKTAESLLFSIYGLIAFLFSCFFVVKLILKLLEKKLFVFLL